VIDVTAAVVPDGGADRVRHLAETSQQVLDRQIGQLGIRLEGRVQVIDVSLVMLIVMELHRPGVDVRLQRIVGER